MSIHFGVGEQKIQTRRREVSRFSAVLFAIFLIACSPGRTPTATSPLAAVPTTPIEDSLTIADTLTSAAGAGEKESQEEVMPDRSVTREWISVAKEDLADHLSVPVEQIDLLEVRAVTWPDASLGCAEPGKMYAQVPQDGLLIRLRVDGQMYFYHSGPDQRPFLCESTSRIIPSVTPTIDEFVPPPDSEIDFTTVQKIRSKVHQSQGQEVVGMVGESQKE